MADLNLRLKIKDDLEKLFLLHYQQKPDGLTMRTLNHYNLIKSDITALFDLRDVETKEAFLRRAFLAAAISGAEAYFLIPFADGRGLRLLLTSAISVLCLCFLYQRLFVTKVLVGGVVSISLLSVSIEKGLLLPIILLVLVLFRYLLAKSRDRATA